VLPAVKVYAPPVKSAKKLPPMKMEPKSAIHDPIEAIEAKKVLEKKMEFFLEKLEEIWIKFGIPEIHKYKSAPDLLERCTLDVSSEMEFHASALRSFYGGFQGKSNSSRAGSHQFSY
jgi:hypothetical protein